MSLKLLLHQAGKQVCTQLLSHTLTENLEPEPPLSPTTTMCWIPSIKFECCGYVRPLPESEISDEDKEWLYEEDGQLYRRCPEAVRTGEICEVLEPYPALTVNKEEDCGKCKQRKEGNTKHTEGPSFGG